MNPFAPPVVTAGWLVVSTIDPADGVAREAAFHIAHIATVLPSEPPGRCGIVMTSTLTYLACATPEAVMAAILGAK